MDYRTTHADSLFLRIFTFGLLFFLFSFGVHQNAHAAQGPTPPPEAQCKERGIDFLCKDEGQRFGALMSAEGNDHLTCKKTCEDAGGAVLVYEKSEGFLGKTTRETFCFGADPDNEKFCKINNATQPWDGNKGEVFAGTIQGVAGDQPQNDIFKKQYEDAQECTWWDLWCKKAELEGIVKSIPAFLALALPTILGFLIVSILGGLFGATASVMQVFIEHTMNIGVVPSNQPFVEFGWNVTRGIVNILFLLILVFIGLATILRKGDYQAQKALPMLIIIALLVNFSALLAGFVVDMGNILTNAFLEKVSSFDGLKEQLGALKSKLFDFYTSAPETGVSESFEIGLQLHSRIVVSALYYVLGFLIMFIITTVFFLRTIVLWVLVILAPLAFAAYILPATRQLWSQWFKNLIQWAFIGVPISFFLYLAGELLRYKDQVTVSVAKLQKQADALSGPAKEEILAKINILNAANESHPFLTNLLSSTLGNFAVLVLMAAGIFVSMQFVPQGAQGAIDFGKKWGGRAALTAGSAAWRFRGAPNAKLFGRRIKLGTDKGIGDSLRGAGQTLQRWGTRVSPETRAKTIANIKKQLDSKRMELNTVPKTNVEQRKALEKEIKDLEKQQRTLPAAQRGGVWGVAGTPWRFANRWVGRGVSTITENIAGRVEAKDNREIAEGEAEGTGQNSRTNAGKINEELLKGQFRNSNRIIGLLKAIVKNGDSDDLQQYLREGVLSSKELGRAMMDAQRGGPPSYRPLFKSMYGRLLTDPESFGFEVEHKKDENGKDTGEILRDALGSPIFKNAFVKHAVGEIPEKLSKQDLANKILGDTIDKGKSGGTEFMEFGGEIAIKHILTQRGGDLASDLVRRPESVEGRNAMSSTINNIIQTNTGEFDATTLRSIYRYFTSSGARSAGLGLDIIGEGREGEEARITLEQFLAKYLRTQGATPRVATGTTSGATRQPSGPGGGTPPEPGYVWNGRMWVPPPRGHIRASDKRDSETGQQRPPRGHPRAE